MKKAKMTEGKMFLWVKLAEKILKIATKDIACYVRGAMFERFRSDLTRKAFLPKESSQKKSLAAIYSPLLLRKVPSTTKSLTSEFGMGSGISSYALPPGEVSVTLKILPDSGFS